MVHFYNWTTFDIIGDLAFGEPFGCLERTSTHPWITDVVGNIGFGVWNSQLYKHGLSALSRFIAPKNLAKSKMDNFKYASEKIDKRVDEGKEDEEKGDFWDHGLKKGINPEEGGMSRGEMKVNAALIVLAGSETTATLLSGTTYHLLQNLEVFNKISNEVRSAFTSSKDITIEVVSKLPYLLAVLNESMRMYPPVPVASARIVPVGGDSVDGMFLPGGTEIQAPVYATCNVDYNFAKPDEFHPERWLEDKTDEFKNDNHAVFQPFSSGPRGCIGKNLAYAEMRLILTKTLFNFDLSIPKGVEDWGAWGKGQKMLPLWEKPPLWVDVKPRKVGLEPEVQIH